MGFRFVEKFSTVTYKCRIVTDCHVSFHVLLAILKRTRDEKGPEKPAGPGTHMSHVVTNGSLSQISDELQTGVRTADRVHG